ncbi:hypothetical protein A5731_22620 [Mycolicibacterium conceptionense]|uniref:Uncharacterized protein n=1 Tax=Mycolicibacterium conceptionense TaxID=451644 RepID=A0A1A0PN96_9MYCO|nr:hypothetical protein [Mycolicibacterium conceptionense]OBB10729.1 hypothetical protein A5718_07920 [Mycolicibacterium conceptionense]OBE98493.1 hypothetical protein A5731_22620 [Mycolicibacterium conceptionense]OBF15021.1 hypothetical protein A5726_22850 [Mycolicibacterium conceptionense]OBF30646.1 hypothetical protein A5720_29835 [Mycolicibacterium conceptionense]OBH94993.1 hypothetical protein A5716_23535 [Mycolicibacterium conceptionense]
MSREQAERIAQKWAEFFPAAEPVELVEPAPAEEPEPGKGNVIPGAGNQPELTDAQMQALVKSGKTNNEMLAEMLSAQNAAYQWYGPQK